MGPGSWQQGQEIGPAPKGQFVGRYTHTYPDFRLEVPKSPTHPQPVSVVVMSLFYGDGLLAPSLQLAYDDLYVR
jgi:hypothetical protein